MPTILAPGPTKVHPEISEWLIDAEREGVLWRSHRSSWFNQLYFSTVQNLRELLGIPDEFQIGFYSSANEVWERSIESLVETKSYHFTGGEFANRWFQFAGRLGKSPERFKYDVDFSGSFADVQIPTSTEAICITQSETGTGFWIPSEQISAIAQQNSNALTLVDVVSAVPYAQVPWEQIDLAYWSVQKGFCLPAGLAVAVISPRAIETAKSLQKRAITGAYHSLDRVAENAALGQTVETPNLLGIYLLSRAVQKYQALGIDLIRRQTEERATALYQRIAQSATTPLVVDPRYRSRTVAAIRCEVPSEPIRKKLISEHETYLAACYDHHKPNGLRIANFPTHTSEEHMHAMKLLDHELTS